MSGVRVFEMHETHGLHVHAIVIGRHDVDTIRQLAQHHGWGRIHVEAIKDPSQVVYVAKYLSKTRDGALQGKRVWSCFGGFHGTRVKDIEVKSSMASIYRSLSKVTGWRGYKHHIKLCQFTAKIWAETPARKQAAS